MQTEPDDYERPSKSWRAYLIWMRMQAESAINPALLDCPIWCESRDAFVRIVDRND